MRQMSADHGRRRCRSSLGTPSISAITVTGSGSATVEQVDDAGVVDLRQEAVDDRWTRGRRPST